MLDVAELALRQCIQREYKTDDKNHSEIAKIQYSYEFLDDYITPQPTLNAFMSDLFQCKAVKHNKIVEDALPAEGESENVPLDSIPTVQSPQNVGNENEKDNIVLKCEDAESWMQKKFNQKNHPLELMVSVNC